MDALDTLWMLVAAVLVFFMQAGFAMVLFSAALKGVPEENHEERARSFEFDDETRKVFEEWMLEQEILNEEQLADLHARLDAIEAKIDAITKELMEERADTMRSRVEELEVRAGGSSLPTRFEQGRDGAAYLTASFPFGRRP